MTESLWRFAVQRWRQRPIERACLRLQDEYGSPVAAVLTALWLASEGRPPDAALGRRVRAQADQFETTWLQPLRTLRRQAAQEPATGELKRQIQEAELVGERLLLEQLEQLVGKLPAADPTSALTWLLMVVPDAGVCFEQQALLSTLADAVAPPA